MEHEDNDFNRNRFGNIWDLARACCRVIIFFVIGILIFWILQSILMPKRFPYIKSYDAGKLAGYYTEESNSIDVLICSTSHASKGILPMEMYEKYSIKAYNLSTSIQPIEVTYYTLLEALKTQNPKVFIYDVSSLYMQGAEKNYWLYVLDEMHFGKNKIALAQEYRKSAVNCDESMRELLIPLLRYHTRWTELSKQDFTAAFSDKHYYGKGGQIGSIIAGSEITIEQMNSIENQLLRDMEKSVYIYDRGIVSKEQEENIQYNIDVSEKNIEWLKKIKALCEENGVQFLAVKVPTMYFPQGYRSAWTVEKYRIAQSICNEYGIVYYDLLYDTNIDIDWSCDTSDQGLHLNLNGAQKVSDALGRYLKEHYELPEEHNEDWDKDLNSYRKVRRVAQLQLEKDFIEYMDKLANEYSDEVIFISVAGDMAAGLRENEINALRELGLQVDFSMAFQKAYVAVIENGEVKYEALSNRQLSYRGVCDKSGKEYELWSSGWWTNSEASIKVEDSEYACNSEGLNIVVYNEESGLVIDSVCFNTGSEEHVALRNNSKTTGFEVAFERYIMEMQNKQK